MKLTIDTKSCTEEDLNHSVRVLAELLSKEEKIKLIYDLNENIRREEEKWKAARPGQAQGSGSFRGQSVGF
jgi:hypothetical protein